MKIQIVKTIGKSTLEVEVEGKDAKEALVRASGITTIPDYCSLCKSTEVELASNKASKDGKPLTYIKVRCSKCTATSTMGEYQDGSGVYWKSFEIFKKDQE